jgi:hypothetical protein
LNKQVQVSKVHIKQPNQNTKISESVGVRNKQDKHHNITGYHDINHIGEMGDSKGHHRPLEFNEILSQINAETLPSFVVTKEEEDSKIIGQTTLARIIEHNDADSPFTKTVFIKNTPEAHQAFGVKNAPTQKNLTGKLIVILMGSTHILEY